MKINKTAVLALIGASTLVSARADDYESYTTLWTAGDGASATITFDLDVTEAEMDLSNSGTFAEPPSSGFITNIMATVTGASSGNGTFDGSSYNFVVLQGDGTVDFDSDLVGQAGFQGFSLYGGGDGGPYTQGAANGVSTDNGSGEVLTLSSFALTATPEPGTLALVGLGSLGSLFLIRRRKNNVA